MRVFADEEQACEDREENHDSWPEDSDGMEDATQLPPDNINLPPTLRQELQFPGGGGALRLEPNDFHGYAHARVLNTCSADDIEEILAAQRRVYEDYWY
jgi:hypothetical protein